MPVIERPDRVFNFSDWARHHPRDQVPGDRLDAQFTSLIRAIETTQLALSDLRRDDGKLRNGLIGPEQLHKQLVDDLLGDIAAVVGPIEMRVRGVALAAQDSERSASLFARDAEAALNVARQLASGLAALRYFIEQRVDYVERASDSVDVYATDSENWANYSKAQADNAIKAKDEALAWAEYLAGPVVDSAKAPAYIAGSPYPHGLYYQPVEGGLAGLWSAKWWALQAQNIVGNLGIYYLGAWDTPPLPGQVNPDTGQTVPNPILPGSIYFDPADQQLKVWNGTQWVQSVALTSSYTARFAYEATAGQTVFSGADKNGVVPVVGASPSEVHVNGVLLLPDEDYGIDTAASTLTINTPLTAGSIVQWDLLVAASTLAPGSINAFKLQPMTPDGVTTDFTMTYLDPLGGDPLPTNVGSGAQLMVSLDGCVQEPGAAYTALGSNLHFIEAPVATASLWAVWYQPGAPA